MFKVKFAESDLCEELILGVGGERLVTGDDVVEQDSEGPHIDLRVVIIADDHLGSHEVRCAYDVLILDAFSTL